MSPPNREPQIITLSLHLYRWLLHLGPGEFLQEYEEMILLDFRQQCRKVYKQQGIYGVLCLWAPMFTNAIVDMGLENILEKYKKIKIPVIAKTFFSIITVATATGISAYYGFQLVGENPTLKWLLAIATTVFIVLGEVIFVWVTFVRVRHIHRANQSKLASLLAERSHLYLERARTDEKTN